MVKLGIRKASVSAEQYTPSRQAKLDAMSETQASIGSDDNH